MKYLWLVLAILLVVQAAKPPVTRHFDPSAAVSISQIALSANKPNQMAEVIFGQKKFSYRVGASSGGFFIAQEDKNVLTIDPKGIVTARTDVLHANKLSTQNLVVGGKPQFKLVALETFEKNPKKQGFSTGGTKKCQGMSILGGRMRKQNPRKACCAKKYGHLPTHDTILVEATAHFVDDFQGEMGYLMVDGHYAWTRGCDQRNSAHAVNVCGDPTIPEGQFSVPIHVSIPHTANNVTIAWGSTLPRAANAYFGLSSLMLSVRTSTPVHGGQA